MSPRTALLLLLPALWLSACGQPQAPATAPAPAPAEPEIPPAQERPANIGLGIKWAPDSPRYQQVRREAWREGSDFTAKVDFSEQQPSRNGSYVVRVLDKSQPAGEALQAWTVSISTADGKPVSGAMVNVLGGMPEHGHGLPSKPTVTAGAKPGQYRIEGLQFSMPGWWEVSFYISRDRRDDTATINVNAG